MAANDDDRYPFRRSGNESEKQSKQPITSESEIRPDSQVDSDNASLPNNDPERVPKNNVGNTWSAGYRNRFPIVSFCAILTILGLCVGVVLVLVLSNTKPVDSWCAGTARIDLPFGWGFTRTWSIPPSVWISIFVFFAGKLMAVAFAEAATISWWTSAMNGVTLSELVHHWESSRSITAVVLNPKKMFSWICLGSIAFTAFAGLGSILQKATSTTIAYNTFPGVSMTAKLADDFPHRFSGYFGSGGGVWYTTEMQELVQEYSKRTEVTLSVENCPVNDGTKCSATFAGIGFQYDCADGIVDQPPYAPSKPYKASKYDSPTLNRTIFDVRFAWGGDQSSSGFAYNNRQYWDIELFSTWKIQKDCAGKVLSYRKCTLSPAVVEYPVYISKGVVTLAPATSTPKWSSGSKGADALVVDRVVKVLPVEEKSSKDTNTGHGSVLFRSTIAGFYRFLVNHFTSYIIVNTDVAKKLADNPFPGDGMGNYPFYTSGPLTDSFASLDYKKFDNECEGVTMPDPTQLIASQLRDLMFRTSVAIAQKNITGVIPKPGVSYTWIPHGSSPQSPVTDANASYVMAQNVYQTNYIFLGLGLGLMLVSICAVLPLFWGYWNLGRKVSLSPLEMAKALQSPTTCSVSKEDQKTPLSVFAAAAAEKPSVRGSNASTKELTDLLGHVKVKYGEVAPDTLGLGVEQHVSTPDNGQVYR